MQNAGDSRATSGRLRLGVAALGFLLILAVVLASAATVTAHQVQNHRIVYDQRVSNPRNFLGCVWSTARVTDGNFGNGFVRGATTFTITNILDPTTCTFRAEKKPGKLKLRYHYSIKNKTNNNFKICWSSGTHYNQKTNYRLTRYRDWRHKPCGKGIYRSRTTSQVVFGGAFQGGGLISPWHRFRN